MDLIIGKRMLMVKIYKHNRRGKKMKTNNTKNVEINIRKWLTLVIIAAGTAVIYALPYIRETFYVPFQNAFHFNNVQLGVLSACFSGIATIAYFVGGFVADRFSVRKLLTFSLFSVGLSGLYFATFPSYTICKMLFVFWGITTVLTYWPAQIKAIRNLGKSEEQGRLFGISESIRGVVATITTFGMLAVFNRLGGDVKGLQGVILGYSIMAIAIGILSWILIKDTPRRKGDSIKSIITDIKKIIKMPTVWLVCALIFCVYSLYGLISYLPPYITNVYKGSVQLGVSLGGSRYIIQIIGGIIGGFTADKIGSRAKVIFIGFFGVILSYVAFIVLPVSASLVTYVIINFAFGTLVVYIMRSIYFALLDEAGVEIAITGAVAGLASAIGYTPDLFMFTMIGSWLDKNPGKSGYNMMFMYGIGVCAVGIILATIMMKITRKKIKVSKI